jgi:CheY-like chemotaxis protein
MARILIIDDCPDEREVLTEMLKGVSHQVCSAPNGKVAMQLLHERHVELVITDMIMPEMDGVETIIALRDKYPDVKIIAVSGGGVAGFDKYVHLARSLGVQKFLPKPFTPEEILRAVQGLIGPP